MDARHLLPDELKYEYQIRGLADTEITRPYTPAGYLNAILQRELNEAIDPVARYRGSPDTALEELVLCKRVSQGLADAAFTLIASREWADDSFPTINSYRSRLRHYYDRMRRLPILRMSPQARDITHECLQRIRDICTQMAPYTRESMASMMPPNESQNDPEQNMPLHNSTTYTQADRAQGLIEPETPRPRSQSAPRAPDTPRIPPRRLYEHDTPEERPPSVPVEAAYPWDRPGNSNRTRSVRWQSDNQYYPAGNQRSDNTGMHQYSCISVPLLPREHSMVHEPQDQNRNGFHRRSEAPLGGHGFGNPEARPQSHTQRPSPSSQDQRAESDAGNRQPPNRAPPQPDSGPQVPNLQRRPPQVYAYAYTPREPPFNCQPRFDQHFQQQYSQQTGPNQRSTGAGATDTQRGPQADRQSQFGQHSQQQNPQQIGPNQRSTGPTNTQREQQFINQSQFNQNFQQQYPQQADPNQHFTGPANVPLQSQHTTRASSGPARQQHTFANDHSYDSERNAHTTRFGRDPYAPFDLENNTPNNHEANALRRWMYNKYYDGETEDKHHIGTEDFLERIRAYQAANGVTDLIILRNVAQSLINKAKTWWRGRQKFMTTLDQFEKGVRARFSPQTQDAEAIIEMIHKREQAEQEHLQEYIDWMLTHMVQVPNYWTEAAQMKRIIRGMNTQNYAHFIGRTFVSMKEFLNHCNELNRKSLPPSKKPIEAKKWFNPMRRPVNATEGLEEPYQMEGSYDDTESIASEEAVSPYEVDAMRKYSATVNNQRKAKPPVQQNTASLSEDIKAELPKLRAPDQLFRGQIGDRPIRCHNCLYRGHNHYTCPFPLGDFCWGCGQPDMHVNECGNCKDRASRIRQPPKNEKNSREANSTRQ